MQVMQWKRAAPRCPSTQTAAGAKSPCGRLLASERMLDGGVGSGRAGVVAHMSCQRCVSHRSYSRPFVGCYRMRIYVHCKPRNHGRATRRRMSRHAFGSALTSIQDSSLPPRHRSRLLLVKNHRRPLAHTRASPMTQAHAHCRSSTCTLKLRHFSARREASNLYLNPALCFLQKVGEGTNPGQLINI
jgi:hypothetical protein